MKTLFCLMLAVVGQTDLEADSKPAPTADGWKILITSDGNVNFERPAITITETNFRATEEATKYPEAIKQMIADKNLDTIAVKTKTVMKGRVVGLFTVVVKIEPTLLMVREGELIRIRSPKSDEMENLTTLREKFNPFGFLALIFLVLIGLGNLITIRNNSRFDFAVATALAAAVTAVTAAVIVTIVAIPATAITATTAAVTAVTAAVIVTVATKNDWRTYRWFSVISAILMAIGVILAVV